MPANDQRLMRNKFDQIDVIVNQFVDQARWETHQTPLTHNGHHLTMAMQAENRMILVFKFCIQYEEFYLIRFIDIC